MLPAHTERMFEILYDHDMFFGDGQIYWNYENRRERDGMFFFVNCNDQFFWASADGEPITDATVELLDECLTACAAHDEDEWGFALFCSRARGMRPQGAFYAHMPKVLWPLFDACGPEREVDPTKWFGNPYPQGQTISKDVR